MGGLAESASKPTELPNVEATKSAKTPKNHFTDCTYASLIKASCIHRTRLVFRIGIYNFFLYNVLCTHYSPHWSSTPLRPKAELERNARRFSKALQLSRGAAEVEPGIRKVLKSL